MPLPEWVRPTTISGLIAPDKRPDDIEWSLGRALRAFAAIATIPTDPTERQIMFLEDALVAWIEWQADTGGSSSDSISIGHVSISSGNASESGAVPLSSSVWAFLRSAGVLNVARARAY
ncbi:hypothetical protein [Cumulibacter soli]|uniref:hypothetical protein n=1 Tax=Cumulibacter soli TaxID=2546344 RepID=UPI00106750DD|nr:hypothetical protein [Cumulibacter soli]